MHLSWDETKAEWICTHEQNKRGSIFLCCLLTVLSAFVPASPQMSVNVSHGICCRRKQICMRVSCFDKLSLLPFPLFSVKSQGRFTVSFALPFLLHPVYFISSDVTSWTARYGLRLIRHWKNLCQFWEKWFIGTHFLRIPLCVLRYSTGKKLVPQTTKLHKQQFHLMMFSLIFPLWFLQLLERAELLGAESGFVLAAFWG